MSKWKYKTDLRPLKTDHPEGGMFDRFRSALTAAEGNQHFKNIAKIIQNSGSKR